MLERLRLLLAPTLSGVRIAASRYGHGDAIWMGTREIAHLHARSEVDARIPRRLQALAIERLDARSARGRTDWIALPVRGDAALETLAELLSLAYADGPA